MSPEEHKAREFAIAAHGDQRYGDESYVVHLQAVVDTLYEFGHGGDLVVVVGGWLHDTVEDTAVTRERIRAEFGEDVDEIVWAVTGQGAHRRERRLDAYGKMRRLGTWRPDLGHKSVTLKLSDRRSNGKSSRRNNPGLFAMYRAEMPGFEEQLSHLGDPRLWEDLRILFAA